MKKENREIIFEGNVKTKNPIKRGILYNLNVISGIPILDWLLDRFTCPYSDLKIRDFKVKTAKEAIKLIRE